MERKGSPGAIMGCKNLKAIAVRGTGDVAIAHRQTFLETAAQWEKNLFVADEGSTTPLGALWHDGGMTRQHKVIAGRGCVAVKNLTDFDFGKAFSQAYIDACKEWTVTPTPSYNCQVACSYDVKITSGQFAGFTASLCGGGEPFEGAAGMVGILDAGQALALTDHYDDIGWEAGHGGSLMGMVFEAYNRGIITKEDTGGLDLTWGNYEAYTELIQQMLERRDFGAKLIGDLKGCGARSRHRRPARSRQGRFNQHPRLAPLWGSFGQIIAGTGALTRSNIHACALMRPVRMSARSRKRFSRRRRRSFGKTIWAFACLLARVSRTSWSLATKSLATATGWDDFTAEDALGRRADHHADAADRDQPWVHQEGRAGCGQATRRSASDRTCGRNFHRSGTWRRW